MQLLGDCCGVRRIKHFNETLLLIDYRVVTVLSSLHQATPPPDVYF